jgi:PEGA domain-containing protein
MNRAVIVGGALTVIVAVGAVVLMREEEPAPVASAPAEPSAPRIVPKKMTKSPADEAPRKAAPKKSETTPAEPAAPAAPTLASLRLESDVPGASVFLDRAFVGNTPLTLDRLEPGTKRVQITATGFDSVQKTIQLVPGPNNISIRVKEVSLDARTPVVHKHGMGSCEGTLTASLDGLQYETPNKGDAFNLPYAQVETFTVDYLQKNLRVKQRGGKTWNFTNKADNADPLFVFHRDVEAARKKLAAGYAPAQ